MSRQPPFLAQLLQAAEQHGIDSEPDHEVGDLQGFVRDLWALLTPAQKRTFAGDLDRRDYIQQWSRTDA